MTLARATILLLLCMAPLRHARTESLILTGLTALHRHPVAYAVGRESGRQYRLAWNVTEGSLTLVEADFSKGSVVLLDGTNRLRLSFQDSLATPGPSIYSDSEILTSDNEPELVRLHRMGLLTEQYLQGQPRRGTASADYIRKLSAYRRSLPSDQRGLFTAAMKRYAAEPSISIAEPVD